MRKGTDEIYLYGYTEIALPDKRNVTENLHSMFQAVKPEFQEYYRYMNPERINENLKRIIEEKKHMLS